MKCLGSLPIVFWSSLTAYLYYAGILYLSHLKLINNVFDLYSSKIHLHSICYPHLIYTSFFPNPKSVVNLWPYSKHLKTWIFPFLFFLTPSLMILSEFRYLHKLRLTYSIILNSSFAYPLFCIILIL